MFIIDDSLPHAYYIYVGSAELVDHTATQSSPVTRLLCVRALVDLLGGIGPGPGTMSCVAIVEC